MLFCSRPLIGPLADPRLLHPRLDGSLDCLPHSLMTLQVPHAANELKDQSIDPSAVRRERPIPRLNIVESGSEQNTTVPSREET